MKLVEALRLLHQAPAKDPFRVFLACGFTPLHLQTFLAAHLQKLSPDRRIEAHIGLFGDCIGNLDRARDAKPDAVALALEWSDFDPRLGFRQLGGWDPWRLDDIIDTVRSRAEKYRKGVGQLTAVTPVAASLPTLPLPPVAYTPGWHGGVFETRLNQVMAELAADLAGITGVRIVSRQRLDALSPLPDRLDLRSELTSGFPYRSAHASELGGLLARLIRPPAPKKGLITDLDDVLWRGILGDVGVEGVSWDLDRKTQIHGIYQQFLRSLADAGILVAIASKNDPARVQEALRRADLLVTADHFFPVEVHWNAKSESIRKILQLWNIGADSVVFVDDSPLELAEVQAVHPEVLCLRFEPEDEASVYRLIISLRDLFGKSRLSEEDAVRRESLRGAAKRNEAVDGLAANPSDFLAQVEARTTISFVKLPPDPRALELVNKTNQFNLNAERYTEAEWNSLARDPDRFLAVVSYTDKYGPLGKIAVLAGRVDGQTLQIQTWVMSCRAFARHIEYCCLGVLFERFGAEEMVFDFRATDRNGPVQDLFRALGVDLVTSPLRLTRSALEELRPPLFHQIEIVST